MKLAALKDQIARDQYAVDPDVVAEALIRRVRAAARGHAAGSADAMLVAAQLARRAARAEASPPARPRDDRAHARACPRRRSRRPRTRTARSPRRRSPPAPTASTPSCAATSATPGGERQRVEVDLDRARRCAARRGAASVARPSERSIIACAPGRGERAPLGQPRLGAQVGARRARRRPSRAAVEDRQAGGRARRARR